MLADNRICKVQSQFFPVLEKQYFDSYALNQNDCRVLMPLSSMFNFNREMCTWFASTAKDAFISLGICDESIWKSNYWQLAHYGVFLSNFVFAYNLKEQDASKKFRLYTSSITLLKDLARRGLLHSKKGSIDIELDKIENEFYSSKKISNTLKDGKKIFSVRIDFEIGSEGKPIFYPTVPKSMINLDDYIFAPVQAVVQAQQSLTQLLLGGMYKVICGTKERFVTLNDQILSSIYGSDRARFLTTQRKDALTDSYYVPSVGASIYTAGVTNIKITDIDLIVPVQSIVEIDLSELKLDFSMLPEYFMEKLLKADKRAVDVVSIYFDIDSKELSFEENINIIKDKVRHCSSAELWKFMKQHQAIFNTAEYLQLPNKYGSEYTRVNIPRTKEELDKLLKAGVFKILTQKRNGSFSTIIGTNSSAELKRILGDNYFAEYEATGTKLRYLRDNIDKVPNIYDTCKGLGLEDVCPNINTPLEEVKHNIDLALTDNEFRKTVIKQPHLSLVRNCQATDKNNYYAYVDVKNIVDLVCLHH